MNKKSERTIANFVAFLKQCELEFATEGCVEIRRPTYRQTIYKRMTAPTIIFDVITEDVGGVSRHVKHSFAEAVALCYMYLYEDLRDEEEGKK